MNKPVSRPRTEMEKTVYTRLDAHGNRIATVIDNNLDEVLCFYMLDESFFQRNTPKKVRIRQLNDVWRKYAGAEADFVQDVILHRIANQKRHVLEVVLDEPGCAFIKQRNSVSTTVYDINEKTPIAQHWIWRNLNPLVKDVLRKLRVVDPKTPD